MIHVAEKANEIRFGKYVIPEPNTGCHLWTGVVDRKGYGRL